MAAIDFSLYLITDRRQIKGSLSLPDVVREALEGGVRAVQLREKDLNDRQLLELAVMLRSLTSSYGAKLFINGRIDIALAAEADGVHLGIDRMPLAKARRLLGAERLIGYSAHGIEEARKAESEGADFVTIGPIFPTPSKNIYGEPLGVKIVTSAARELAIPVFALGGLSSGNIAAVMAEGAHGVALISAIIAAADPRSATTSLLQAIETHNVTTI